MIKHDNHEDNLFSSIDIHEDDLPFTGLLDQHGNKLYRDERIKLGFDLERND